MLQDNVCSLGVSGLGNLGQIVPRIVVLCKAIQKGGHERGL